MTCKSNPVRITDYSDDKVFLKLFQNVREKDEYSHRYEILEARRELPVHVRVMAKKFEIILGDFFCFFLITVRSILYSTCIAWKKKILCTVVNKYCTYFRTIMVLIESKITRSVINWRNSFQNRELLNNTWYFLQNQVLLLKLF